MNSRMPRPVHHTWVGAAASGTRPPLSCACTASPWSSRSIDDEAEAVEQDRAGHQYWIRVGRHPPNDEVGCESGQERHPGEGDQIQADMSGAGALDRRLSSDDYEHGKQQQPQFCAASRRWGGGCRWSRPGRGHRLTPSGSPRPVRA